MNSTPTRVVRHCGYLYRKYTVSGTRCNYIFTSNLPNADRFSKFFHRQTYVHFHVFIQSRSAFHIMYFLHFHVSHFRRPVRRKVPYRIFRLKRHDAAIKLIRSWRPWNNLLVVFSSDAQCEYQGVYTSTLNNSCCTTMWFTGVHLLQHCISSTGTSRQLRE